MIQTTVVVILVACSVLHASWVLMPRILRQRIARRLLPLPLPGLLAGIVQDGAVAHSGCACHGCEKARPQHPEEHVQPSVVKAQPVVFHPRRKA